MRSLKLNKRDKKFSKKRQRNKNSIRAAINDIKAKLLRTRLKSVDTNKYLNKFNLDTGLRLDGQLFSFQGKGEMPHKMEVMMYKGENDDQGLMGDKKIHVNMIETTDLGDSEINDTLRAILETGPLPDEILVSAKRSDEADIEKQVRQMVDDMNEEARSTGGLQYTIQKGVVAAQPRNGKEVNLTFGILPVAALSPLALRPVMNEVEFINALGKKNIAEPTGSTEYTALLTALRDYNQPANLNNKSGLDGAAKLFFAAKKYQAIRKESSDKNNAINRLIEQVSALHPFALIPIGDSHVVGHGANGPVNAFDIEATIDGKTVAFEGVFKEDKLIGSDPAFDAGIPRNNPQESLRGVTTSEVNKLVGIDVIPLSIFTVNVENNGAVKIGQAMKVVHGTIGHLKYNDNIADSRVVDVPYETSKVIQKGLSDLQVFDNIIGAADRHPANFIFETKSATDHTITGVKGIDNDDTFGSTWLAKPLLPPGNFVYPSKTPPVPPLVDVETALKVLRIDDNEFRELLKYLNPAEVNAAMIRLATVKTDIGTRVLNNHLASSDGLITQDQAKELAALTHRPPVNGPVLISATWGTLLATQMHQGNNGRNSYLGDMLHRKNLGINDPIGGVIPPDFK